MKRIVPVVRAGVAALLLVAAVAGLTGCGAWCGGPPTPDSVKSAGKAEAVRLQQLPGVVSVSPRYWQPEDKHCASPKYLETAPWSTEFRATMTATASVEQITAVKAAAPDAVSFDVKASAAHAAWSLPVNAAIPGDALRAQALAVLPHVTRVIVPTYNDMPSVTIDRLSSIAGFIDTNPSLLGAGPVSIYVLNRFEVVAGEGGMPRPLIDQLIDLSEKHPHATIIADNTHVYFSVAKKSDAQAIVSALGGPAFAGDHVIRFFVSADDDRKWSGDGVLGQPAPSSD